MSILSDVVARFGEVVEALRGVIFVCLKGHPEGDDSRVQVGEHGVQAGERRCIPEASSPPPPYVYIRLDIFLCSPRLFVLGHLPKSLSKAMIRLFKLVYSSAILNLFVLCPPPPFAFRFCFCLRAKSSGYNTGHRDFMFILNEPM